MNTNIFLNYKSLRFVLSTLCILGFSIFINAAFAQEKAPLNFGKLSPSDFGPVTSKVLDSNSNAVVIADIGNTSFVGNRKGWLSYVFKRQTRIKIINKKAFDAATVKIVLYRNGQDEEKLDNIEATCYNLENGKVVGEKLDKKDLFEDKLDKNNIEKKFTIPGIKEGSIIEYTYTIISDFDFNLPRWSFQHVYYPVLWSEYDISIPTLLSYTSFKQGVHPFYIDQPGMAQQNYNIMHTANYNALTSGENSYIVSAQVVKHRWVMKDLPGLNIENYISTPYNYIDRIEFQLAKIYDGNATTDVVNSWAKYNDQLLSESDFGLALKPGYFDFSKEVNEVIGNETDPVQKAKKIYYYVQQAVTCTNSNRIYATNSLSTVLQNKTGNVAEINLLLAAMLRQAGLQADPVLLSTREFGYNSPRYPVLQRLNYVICRCTIDGRPYYLDATHRQLGFGSLPDNCYNGHARIISEKDPGPVYFWADSLKEPETTAVFIINDEKGKGLMSGSLEMVPGLLESFNTRNRIGSSTEKMFFADMQSLNTDIKIENPGIDSMQKPEYPVKIHYDLSFNVDDKEDVVYYNPIVCSSFKENPLKAAERKYPVEMSYPIDDTYILNMEIPAGYVLDELPKSSRVAYNGSEGFFEYLIQGSETNVQLKTHLKFNKAFFSPEEYNSLRDFFTYVIKKQSEQIVFKRKNNFMKNLLYFILFIFSTAASAQSYSAGDIPDSLMKNADAVTRYQERVFEIKSPGKAIEHEKRVNTILDESGDYLGRYRSYYDKFTSINNISGILYDAKGKEMKRAKKKDMQDISGTGEESLMTDTRYKINDFYNRSYPYTVSYEEDDEINGMLQIGDWLPQGINKVSVQYSKYIVITPKDYQLRYKAMNCSMEPVITEEGGRKIYTWEIKNLPARTAEVYSPSWKKILPYVMIAPSDFEAQGYKGNMSTWENYGRFIYDLLKGRDQLTDDVRKQVHVLTDNLKTPKDKIAVLYEYLQKNTRYISIQLGIGGLQPFDAAFVSTKRYGDCKALSNFMVALLKEAGIKGNSVVIKSGEGYRYMNDNFPSDQFDHVISCVPLGKDTVWLECTSQTLPAGYLSSFTADRYGLLIDETGGKLVHTPKYGLDVNLQFRKVDATVNDEGNLSINVQTRYRAEQQDNLEQYINGMSKDRLMEYLKSEIDLPTYDVVKFNYTQDKAVVPDIDEHLDLEATNYAQVSGRRLFIVPDILTRSQIKLKPDDDRRYAIELPGEYREIDSVEIKIPKGYQPEAVAKDLKLESRFGKYSASVKVFPDKVTYYRLYEQYSGNFPASSYADLAKFYEQVYKADRTKVVLIKTN